MRDLALAAVRDVADDMAHVGDFLAEERVDDVIIVRFISLHPGYPGWHWSAALVDSAGRLTVNEVWMEPGEGALAVLAWKPWSERVRPGDLGAGDVVATDPTDVRITPGYTAEGEDVEEALAPAQWQLGLGRERVLSIEGLADAAERWRSGDDGPDSQVARLADHTCSTCAWLLPIGGLLGQAFGVCAHDMSPSDGHVVSLDHGCGAHSDVRIEPSPIPVTDMLIDETTFIPVRIDRLVEESEEPIEAVELDASGDDSTLETVAATNDVTDSEQADNDAGEGDVAPPEDVAVTEEVAENEAEQGE